MIKVKNIIKIYKSKDGSSCTAVDGINISFDEKGFVFIVGKSGSGKSTLLNLLSGMDCVSSGEIFIDGKSAKEFKANDFDIYRNTYVGFVFQDFSLIDSLTVGENIEMSIKLQGKEITKDEVIEALDKVGLQPEYYNRATYELSGGEKQRVAIARALIKNPKIIFADEPTGSLDAQTSKQCLDLFKELAKDHLVIAVSHDIDNALQYGDRIITLRDGKVIQDKIKVEKIDLHKLKEEYQSKVDEFFTQRIEDDSDKQDNFVSVETHIPLKQAFKISIENFKKKKIHFSITLLLTIIALSIFSLASIMQNYSPHQASLMTFEKLDIKTLMLSNTVNIEDSDEELTGINSFIAETREATIFSYPIAQDAETNINGVMRAYRFSGMRIPSIDGNRIRNNIFANTVSIVVESNGNINDFYNAQIIIGKSPEKNNEVIEIAISDCIAESIMRYGGRFYNDEVVHPSTGYQYILEKVLVFNGINFKIVGIYDTDYEKVLDQYIKDTSIKMHDNFTARFNLANVYTAGLIAKNALSDYLTESQTVAVQLCFLGENTHGDEYIGIQPTIILGQKTIGENFSSIIFYQDGYSSNSQINDNDIVLPYSYISPMLEDVYFENLTSEILKNLQFNIYVEDTTRQILYENPNLIAVYDDSVIGTMTTSVLLSESKLRVVLRESLVIANLYIPVSDDSKLNEKLLNYLDNNNLWYLTYATSELKTFNSLFSYLGDLLNWITLVMFMFVLILIYGFISSSIKAKTHEIGVLRAMGARGIDVAKIFSIESAIVFIIQTIFSFICIFIGVAFTNTLLTKQFTNTLSLLSVTPLSLIYVVLVSLVTVAVASIIPLLRLIKMKPVEVMKARE
ncbi:MAG: ATP-binding cassette domain-containing protein [Christensenellaceae bacterium]|jgi:ABC-type lipoprotein export system ATPase subunit/ABC-type antimicrobial peptide transport system permease subunit|nr:ATP-binding cassette domain-containing protein [Christensenellaceae bacterium]